MIKRLAEKITGSRKLGFLLGLLIGGLTMFVAIVAGKAFGF